MKQKTDFNLIFTSTIVITIALLSVVAATNILLNQTDASFLTDRRHGVLAADAPIATSGKNVYITWWTNKTGNSEVMFRASIDNGQTFGNKINLSNSTKAESVDAHIDSSGDRVFVTWWERNETHNEPVLRISTDNGEFFELLLKLGANGTLGEDFFFFY